MGTKSGKQAVILIHGIGNQKPMATLRGFVEAVWTSDQSIHHEFAGRGMWSKPDNVSRNYELRRLTTTQNIAGIQTDFYEYYWAHLMAGTSYGHVLAWARSLLFRRPSAVPPQLKSVYWLALLLLSAALVAFAYAAYAKFIDVTAIPAWLSGLVGLVLAPLAGFLLLEVVGDAARYLHVAPANIQCRHEIRQAGVALLKELHDPRLGYERIILVGHSLGSVIGYDILTHAWVDFNRQHTTGQEAMSALDELEKLAASAHPRIDKVQTAQCRYFAELKANGNAWRVTDFITLGSPLTHAPLLLAEDEGDLRRRQEDREFPTCLPALETAQRDKEKVRRFSYELDQRRKNGYRIPHHAAVFAPTRWTNLYFPSCAIFWGDLVGGPINGVMGGGIRDVPVRTRQRFGLFSHTLYWEQPPGDAEAMHIEALREALDLTD